MLIKGKLSAQIQEFLTKQNSEKIEDPQKAIIDFSNFLEDVIYQAISEVDIIIPAGQIRVAIPTGIGVNVEPLNIIRPLR